MQRTYKSKKEQGGSASWLYFPLSMRFPHWLVENGRKVEALEAMAEVSAEMGSLGGNFLPGTAGSSVEARFRALEASNSVDDELNKLKGLLGPSSSSSNKKPLLSGAGSGADDLDDELEKLKPDAGL